MKDITKIAIFGGIGIGLIATMAYFSKQARLLQDACYTVTGAVIHQMGFNKFSFSMLVNISNKSDINFTVTNQRYNIYINKMLVAKIEREDKLVVIANGKTTVNIDVDFNPQDLLKQGMENILYLINDKEKIVIEIKGYLSLRAGMVKVKDYEVDERISLAELLTSSPKKENC